MKVCKACRDLDGKSHITPPHADLALMSSDKGGASGFLAMVTSWRCMRCDTWLRQHSGYGDQPGAWEALLQINPWLENGYQVFGEVKKGLGSSVFEGWYQIEVPQSRSRGRYVVFKSMRVGMFKTQFAATLAALEAGRHHAMQLSPQADAAPPAMPARRAVKASPTYRSIVRRG